ncbi:TLDc domain-containing protein [Entamoeba marina]
MGNNQSFKLSRKATQCGSIYNPNEYVLAGKVFGKQHMQSMSPNSLEELSLCDFEQFHPSESVNNNYTCNSGRTTPNKSRKRLMNQLFRSGLSTVFTPENYSLYERVQHPKKQIVFQFASTSTPRSLFSTFTQSTPRSGKSPFQENTSNEINLKIGMDFQQKVNFFVEQTGLGWFSVVYDSYIDDFDSRTFNSKISCMENIMVLCITKVGTVGFFHKNAIQHNDYMTHINDSDEFFVFTMINEKTEPVVLTRKANENKTITTYPIHEKNFVFHSMIKDSYDLSVNLLNPFTDNSICEKTDCERLVVLNLYCD